MIKKIAHYIFELGNLKKFKHCGIKFAGIKDPDSLAEHAARASQIAYILGKLEKVNAEKCALMTLIHDNGEIRVGDQHKISAKYSNNKPNELAAFKDQTKNLPEEIGNTFESLYKEFEAQKTPESITARDADMLETAFQAKEYLDNGYKTAKLWIDSVRTQLKTKSGKKILAEMEKTHFAQWWQNLKA